MDNEAIPQRNTGVRTSLPAVAEPSKDDEQNFSTLQAVHKTFVEAVNDLSKDFNAFEILKADNKEEAAAKLLYSIEVKQGVYDIVAPLLDTVENTLGQVNAQFIRNRSK